MRSAIGRFLASLGAMGGDISSNLIQKLMAGKRVSKHRTTAATFKTKGRKRLTLARGAGSINAKADILQLCRLGRWDEAADMDQAHEHLCGEKLFGPEVRERWRSYALEEALTIG
jgi:hypothetical protein